MRLQTLKNLPVKLKLTAQDRVNTHLKPLLSDPKRWVETRQPALKKFAKEKILPWVIAAIAAGTAREYFRDGGSQLILILGGLLFATLWKPAVAIAAAATMATIFNPEPTNITLAATGWLAWLVWRTARNEGTSLDNSPAGIVVGLFVLWVVTSPSPPENVAWIALLGVGMMASGVEGRLSMILTCLWISADWLINPYATHSQCFVHAAAAIGLISTPGILGKLLAISPTLALPNYRSGTAILTILFAWIALPVGWVAGKAQKKWGSKITISTLIIGTLTVIFTAPIWITFVTGLAGKNPTFTGRKTVIWPTSADLIQVRPWEGWGADYAGRLNEATYLGGFCFRAHHTHNPLLEYWMLWGAGAAILFAILIPLCIFHRGNGLAKSIQMIPLWSYMTGILRWTGPGQLWMITAIGQSGVTNPTPSKPWGKKTTITIAAIAIAWAVGVWLQLPKKESRYKELWMVQATNPESTFARSSQPAIDLLKEKAAIAKGTIPKLSVDASGQGFGIIIRAENPEGIEAFAKKFEGHLQFVRTDPQRQETDLARKNQLIALGPVALALLLLARGRHRTPTTVGLLALAILISRPPPQVESDLLRADADAKPLKEWKKPEEWPQIWHQELSVRLHALTVATLLETPTTHNQYSVAQEGDKFTVTMPRTVTQAEKEKALEKAEELMRQWKQLPPPNHTPIEEEN